MDKVTSLVQIKPRAIKKKTHTRTWWSEGWKGEMSTKLFTQFRVSDIKASRMNLNLGRGDAKFLPLSEMNVT